MIKLTGMWENEGKNGKYFSGTLGFGKLLMFPNEHKRSDRDPDWFLLLAEKQKDRDGGDQPRRQSRRDSRPPADDGPPPDDSPPPDDDDLSVPF